MNETAKEIIITVVGLIALLAIDIGRRGLASLEQDETEEDE